MMTNMDFPETLNSGHKYHKNILMHFFDKWSISCIMERFIKLQNPVKNLPVSQIGQWCGIFSPMCKSGKGNKKCNCDAVDHL